MALLASVDLIYLPKVREDPLGQASALVMISSWWFLRTLESKQCVMNLSVQYSFQTRRLALRWSASYATKWARWPELWEHPITASKGKLRSSTPEVSVQKRWFSFCFLEISSKEVKESLICLVSSPKQPWSVRKELDYQSRREAEWLEQTAPYHQEIYI